jgi:hypothetical protein
MKIRVFKNLAKVAFGAALLLSLNVHGQWSSGVYTNEWLAGKYGQTWLRIGVTQKGVQKVALSGDFLNKSTQLHLYHRGVEVSLISASSNQIEFYGVPNDGASDALLYRPYTGTRANPYYSWFSDESAYFLTFSNSTPTKLVAEQGAISVSGVPEPYHVQKEITQYTNDYTHDETTNPVTFPLDQSYFDEGKSLTGSAVLEVTYNGSPIGNPIFTFPFTLTNVVRDVDLKPKFEALFNSRTFANHFVKTSIGKTAGSFRDYPDNLQFSSFAPYKKEFEFNASATLANSDVDANGTGVIQWEELTKTDDFNTVGVFSFAYIRKIYPQSLDMASSTVGYFNLPGTVNSQSRVQITNAPSGARVYDITNSDAPKFIPSASSGGTLEFMIERTSNQELNLVVLTTTIDNTSTSPVTFTEYNPSDYDYLIVSNSTLFSKAQEYAAYRNSAAGGSYHSLAVNIKDIYNQFNYGEPSPVAIRHFAYYMIHNAPQDKHNLLLIGPSTTIPKIARFNREIPEEVPTIGYPGSDVLLVEGLTASTSEYPTIPVGRISATLPDQVANYLNKVKQYEGVYLNSDWRKKVLHISGGIHEGENITFAGYLSDYNYYVTGGTFGGNVTQHIKGDADFAYPSNALNISSEINAGVGFSAYYGHGRPTLTDNNIGFATDPARSYSNSGKYPLLYFNGCGVGNIFSGRFAPFASVVPEPSNLMPLSTDWVVAADKGAIAVIANSYYAFELSSKIFVGALHKNLFKGDGSRKTIGKIHQEAEKDIVNGYAGARISVSSYDIANNHQSLLQGDPAIIPLLTTNVLPVSLVSWKGELTTTSKVKLTWETAWEKSNSHFDVQRSFDAKTFETIGRVEGSGDSEILKSYSFTDETPKIGNNYYRLAQVDLNSSGSTSQDKISYSRIINISTEKEIEVVFHPNPTSDVLKINLGKTEVMESIKLYNLKGQLIQSKVSDSELNLKNLTPGKYIVEAVTTSGKVYRSEVLKQ